VTGSTQFGINLSNNFRRTLKRLAKVCYKSEKEKQLFITCLQEIYRNLEIQPDDPPDFSSVTCHWLRGVVHQEECELRKLFFSMPGRSGASGEGRILYIVDNLNREVELQWVYTHDQYKKQPPYDALREVVLEWMNSRSELRS
jgi:hypothetical protein